MTVKMYALKLSKKTNPLWWADGIANGIEEKRENQQGQEIYHNSDENICNGVSFSPMRTSAMEVVSVKLYSVK